MTKNQLHFTAFSDETGSITNNQPEIFGGSLFIIEDSEIDECRSFLKQYYPKGIHCREIKRKNKIQQITEDIGAFLKNKNCFAVAGIETNKNLMRDYEPIFYEEYRYQPTQKDLSLIKRWFYYAMILRASIPGLYLLTQNKPVEKITLKLFMEDFKRDEKMDRWDLHNGFFAHSIETYKLNEPIKNVVEKLTIKPPESRTKAEEIMFSFPDLFAYSIRRMVTHREHNLYDNLKHIFNRAGYRGYCSDPSFFKMQETPPGIFISSTKAEELNRLSGLDEEEWREELNQTINNK